MSCCLSAVMVIERLKKGVDRQASERGWVMIYVYIDCDKTQDYIFSSRRLRGIRNGSRLIDEADRQAGELVPCAGGETLRALGGVVFAKFPDCRSADAFLREARALYRRYGIGITAACRDCSTVNDLYHDILEPLLVEVRNKKDCPQVTTLPPPDTILAATCAVSGRGAAQGLVAIARGEPLQRASAVEQTKWQEVPDPQREELVKGWQRQIRLPDTAEEIVGWRTSETVAEREVPGTSEARLLGMVFADVNGMGGLLPHLAREEARYKQFSRDLKDCLLESLRQSLQAVLEKPVTKREAQRLPFRLLFLGGDDLCYAVTGAYALPLTRRFIECFEERSEQILKPFRDGEAAEHLPPCLTISAGIVIAPYRYPILSFRRLGRDLESYAKQVGRYWARLNGQAYPPSLVDFHIVMNDMAGTVKEIRSFLQTPYPVDGEAAALFGGPYLISRGQVHPAERRLLRLGDLLKAAEGLLRFRAGGKLQDLQLLLSRAGAQGLYREWWEHLDDAKKQWRDVCQVLKVPDEGDKLPLRGIPHLNTPVLDALALTPLVELKERWEG